jgi:hypothetical protein
VLYRFSGLSSDPVLVRPAALKTATKAGSKRAF